MDWFNNLNIFKKIAIISVIAIATLIFTTLSAFLAQQENQTSLVKLESTIAPLLLISGENVVLLERVDEVYSQSVSFGDSDLKANAESTLDKLKSNLNRVKALDKDHASAVSATQERLDRYRTTTSTIVDAMLSGGDVDFDKIGKLSGEKSALLEQSLSDLRQYSARIDDQFKGLLGQIRDSSSQSLTNTVLFGIISCGLMIVITVFVGRKISDTVNNLAQSLSELAHGEGDLNHKLPVESNDELGQVASNFNHFMALLKDAISHVIDVTNPLSRSSTTLISHTQDARDAAVKQSSDTENAQNLIRELQSSVNEIVESANQAAQLVSDVSSESENGIRVVNQTIQVSGELDHDIQEAAATVQELANDSENVHSILDVINSIADQTNLLALNAAIEAARAGDQGRGFAVVADEVRALASKTAESTTEIRQVLEQLRSAASNSTSRMKTASEKSKLNQQHAISTGNALEQIKEKISHLSEVNSQIAAATEHQNDATRHVVSNIEDVTAAFNVTTQTFSDVEGIARQLHQFSDQLQEASSRFKV